MSNRGMSGNGGNARGSADSWMTAQRRGEHQAQDKPRRQQQDAGRDRRDEVHLEEIERLDVGMDEQRRTGDQAEQGAPERAEQERGDRDGNQLHDDVGHPLVGLPQAHQAQLGERERDRGDGHRDEHHRLHHAPARCQNAASAEHARLAHPRVTHARRLPPVETARRPRQPWGHYIVRTAHPARSGAEGPSEIVEPHEGMRGARFDAVAAAGAEATQPHHRAQRDDQGFVRRNSGLSARRSGAGRPLDKASRRC